MYIVIFHYDIPPLSYWLQLTDRNFILQGRFIKSFKDSSLKLYRTPGLTRGFLYTRRPCVICHTAFCSSYGSVMSISPDLGVRPGSRAIHGSTLPASRGYQPRFGACQARTCRTRPDCSGGPSPHLSRQIVGLAEFSQALGPHGDIPCYLRCLLLSSHQP